VVLLRDRTESANLALDLAVPGLAQVREAAYERHLRVLYHDDAMAAALASTPGAIGVLPLQLARSHRPPLKVLALDGVHPSPETLADGSFRAARPLALVLRPDRRDRVGPFLDFLASPRGQDLLRAAGVLPTAPAGLAASSPGVAEKERP
jgi:phosphate transport system substrate-binding protein